MARHPQQVDQSSVLTWPEKVTSILSILNTSVDQPYRGYDNDVIFVFGYNTD